MNIEEVFKKIEEYGVDDDFYLKFSVGLETEEYELLVEYAKKARDIEIEMKALESKLNIYRSANENIGMLGHIDIKGQYEKAFYQCLKIASDAYVDSGDIKED